MKKITTLYLLILPFLYFSCGESKICLILKQVSSNYPLKEYSWFNAPPRLDLVFEIENNSGKKIAIPLDSRYSEKGLKYWSGTLSACKLSKIQLYRITGMEYAVVDAGGSISFALTTNFKELEKVKEDCQGGYIGKYLQNIGENIQITYINKDLGTDSLFISGVYYEVPQKLTAVRAKDFKFEAPVRPIEE